MRGLLVGRFQPFHLGHRAVVEEILRSKPEETLLLGVGSAQDSHTVDNPFTAGERHEMIVRALADLPNRQWEVIPLEDIHRHALWVAHLESLLPPFETVYTNNPLTRLLFENSGYSVIAPRLDDRDRFEGRKVREAMATGADWESLVPPPVATFLRGIEGPSRIRLLAAAGSPGGQ